MICRGLAAGENACTAVQFQAMFAAGAVDYAQPSVTKVGGVTEFLKIAALAEASGVRIMAHSPYIGPGFLASLHLAAALPDPGLIERFHVTLEANPMGPVLPKDGQFMVPDGPGWAPIPTRRWSPPTVWTVEPWPMYPDVADLRDFYQTPAGRIARRMIRRQVRTMWPNLRDLSVLGVGYATPICGPSPNRPSA